MSGQKPNAYLEKRKNMEQEIFNAGIDIGYQRCLDYMQALLRQPKYVGKNTFGRERWSKLYEGLKECDEVFGDAYSQNVEADYCQEQLDSVLREIWQDDLMPVPERYPMIKKFGYKKAKKGWV